YLGAEDFVPVTQAHIMADTESLGVAGVEWLERMARLPVEQRRVRIPPLTHPPGTPFSAAHPRHPPPHLFYPPPPPPPPPPPRPRRLRGARHSDDRYLHQLPDHHGAGARRARRLRRHRCGDLFEQRVRRALQFRRRAVGAQRRAHGADAALWLPSRRAAPGDV